MFKLNAMNVDGSVRVEQIFSNYVTLKEKQKELIAMGLTTLITPMSKEEHLQYSEDILKSVLGLNVDVVLN